MEIINTIIGCPSDESHNITQLYLTNQIKSNILIHNLEIHRLE